VQKNTVLNPNRKHINPFLLTLKGVVMGAANKVPGVSGGIVAFVMGFYEEFIYALQKFNIKAGKLFFSGRFKQFYQYVNGRFLSLLFLGMLISYFSVSKLLDYLIERHELYVWSVFFGMIIGSIFYIYKDFTSWNSKTILCACLGILAGLSISFLSPATQNDNLWFVFLCGIISVTGMALPGFSGSFILILLGNYVLLLVDAVNALFDTFVFLGSGDFSFLTDETHLRLLKVLVVFTLGSIVGLISLSHLLGYILKHYKLNTLALIMGFITGSLGVVWPWKEALFKTDNLGAFINDSNGAYIIENYQRYIPELSLQTGFALLCICSGAALVLGLEWYGKHRKHIK
jgi:putative membrane protein